MKVQGQVRGAVVARALSGLISKGILKPEHMNYFGHVWGDYAESGQVSLPGLGAKHAKGGAIANYKEMCSDPNPEIEFLGVFETVVGGHGLSEVAQRLRLRERKVENNVVNAVHLLAIDESRSFFRPVLWTGRKETSGISLDRSRYFEQMWIPGVHSDIGGAYSNRYLGDLSLVTMIDRVLSKTKLRFKLPLVRKHNREPVEEIRIHDEFSGKWGFINPAPEPRVPDRDIEQTVHPYAPELVGRLVNYKRFSKLTPYSLTKDFLDLPPGVDFMSGAFETMFRK